MHLYRTHTCGELRLQHVGQVVRLSGWVHRKRDHGGLVFIDLRDHYGVTQCVIEPDNPIFSEVEKVRAEWVITLTGRVAERPRDTVNPALPTGEVELRIEEFQVQSEAEELPVPVFGEPDYPEELRLKYRFLDLRREHLHRNIVLRSNVIASLRRRMVEQGFLEYQTPILTASSPEGARDFLVPSRLHPGKFYALPQAPQQFKQLLMVAGFDRYFQIAPCFRDEDARADRSPGEFYQLDLEMSFVTQEDVFAAVEPVLHGVFEEFANGRNVPPRPFPRIPYRDAMLKYGTDKPDLRNPLKIVDVSQFFMKETVTFIPFKEIIEKGGVVRAISAPEVVGRPRSFFDKLNEWGKENLGLPGIAHIQYKKIRHNISITGSEEVLTRIELNPESNPIDASGPLKKFFDVFSLVKMGEWAGVEPGHTLFFIAHQNPLEAARLAGLLRTKLGEELGLIEPNVFRFCWITDFPMYEWNETENRIDFSHNPFSMPQGGLEALNTKDPLEILGYQYDIVCNGIELSSGAIRNHEPEIMMRAFEIAGYSREDVESRFGGMLNAFRYGAPPHGGIAPGVDRIVMLLADAPNIREVILFPLNQQAQDLLMNAPSEVAPRQLRELHIRVVQPADAKARS